MEAAETEDIARSYKELKKMGKQRKKDMKKAKKREKLERKISKKEAKMKRKGVFLEEVAPPTEAPPEQKPEEFAAAPWVRKSTETVPLVEKKIDVMSKRGERSRLHDLFEERYGESLIVPDTYKEYELSEAEKARLARILETEEKVEVAAVPVVSAPAEGAPVEAAAAPSEKVEAAAEEPTEAEKAEREALPFYHPKQLWLYNKYGKGQPIWKKVLILIPSILGFVILIIPRVIIFLIMMVVKKIKGRKSKKAAPEAASKA